MKSLPICVLMIAACLHLAYYVPATAAFGVLFSFVALMLLGRQSSLRFGFYGGLAGALLFMVPHLWFLWDLFNTTAMTLWLLVAMWHGWFVVLVGAVWRWHERAALFLAPFLWMGLEYFRCEVWMLKFAYLTGGFLLPMDGSHSFLTWNGLMGWLGIYGTSGLLVALAAWVSAKISWQRVVCASAAVAMAALLPPPPVVDSGKPLKLAGAQLEFPSETKLLETLDRLRQNHPQADCYVFSELAMTSSDSSPVRKWCQEHQKTVIIGGYHIISSKQWENTAFVFGPDGQELHRQVKSVPVQFFDDGLPAKSQANWESPYGRLGICICYDLNYRHITDRFADRGMQVLVVPTMDKLEWGQHQHEMAARLASIRAVEHGVPVFRITSSGNSVAAQPSGKVVATAPFGADGAEMAAEFSLPTIPRIPPDRYLAPACSILAAAVALAILLRRIIGFFRKTG